MITVSVPGKVFVMGEHAVVYGKPALLASINKRLTVTVDPEAPKNSGYVLHIASLVKKQFRFTRVPNVRIQSDIPEGYHIGSSAAVAVGVAGALSYWVKKIWNPDLFNQIAYEAEKTKHTNPSGADNTIVTFGGFVWYRKELEFLKSMWQLTIPKPLHHFYLLDTGKPKETTADMVSFVAKQKGLEKEFLENERQTKRVAIALKTSDDTLLVDAIRKGERTLEHMGVVGKRVIPLIRAVEKKGGAAKILGGGGRKGGVGYILLYTRKPPKEAVPIRLGEEGVRLESRV